MRLPTLRKRKRRNTFVGLDLGSSSVKLVVVRAAGGEKCAMGGYAVRDLPPNVGQPGSEEAVSTVLRKLIDDVQLDDRAAFVTISTPSVMISYTQFPAMPLVEIKNALKLNTARYLRRDYSDYVLDCRELSRTSDKTGAKSAVLVGGVSKTDVQYVRDVLQRARLEPLMLDLSAIAALNALEVNFPEAFQKGSLMLVDMGHRFTSMTFVLDGKPTLTRIMHFGGATVTEYLSQLLSLDLAAAEEEKHKMSEPMLPLVRNAISPLSKEIRSSIDFFERQHETALGRAFVCGGSARSPQLVQLLGAESGVTLEVWNPLKNLGINFEQGEGQAGNIAPVFAAAAGEAMAHALEKK
jgi:type IV pilus assembly protein PilM